MIVCVAIWLQTILAGALVIPLGLDLYMPVPDANPLTDDRIALGRRLFFDARLSRDHTLSCSSCHDPSRAFSDAHPVAVGILGRTGRRNAPALINRGYGRAFFWDARSVSLEEQVLEPIAAEDELGSSAAEAAARVGLSVEDLSFALASYVRSILSGNAPFDRFVNGDRAALSDEQQRGLQIFRGKGNCTACHMGPTFSDERTHVTGIAWRTAASATVGAGSTTAPPSPGPTDVGAGRGAFKTPTLREVARSSPYMHDGSLATLAEVVDFYDRGGQPNPYLDAEIRRLCLTPEDKRALVAFLEALSGDVQEGVRPQAGVGAGGGRGREK